MGYIKKRILRIYPGFIAVFIFCFLIVGPIGYMKSLSLSEYLGFIDSVHLKRETANMLSLQSPV
jgi:peptidoglycan/LPS O-acetylase OafA/YrhL